MKSVVFFNNKSGVGKTVLVYHLAYMFAERGVSTLAVDLDPQANLSSLFLPTEDLENIWTETKTTSTTAIQPFISGLGDIAPVYVDKITGNLHLIVGDLRLSGMEDQLAESWEQCLAGKQQAFRAMSAIYRLINEAATRVGAQLVLMDLGPSLGPLNRAALLAAEHLVVPLAPDLFSLQGLENLGPTLRTWRKEWEKRLNEVPKNTGTELVLPAGKMEPQGYVVINFGVRDRRPINAYDIWAQQIPRIFRTAVLDKDDPNPPSLEDDPYRLASLKHHRSLMPMATIAHKPMFFLKTADGAIGVHQEAVRNCYKDFLALTRRIASSVGMVME